MKKLSLIMAASLMLGTNAGMAAVVDDMLVEFGSTGSAKDGAEMWKKEYVDQASGEKRSCVTCHGADLKVAGKHATTGKPIEPLAPSVNKQRLTDRKEIEKWFKRNCKWTLGRECTAQEKANFLVFIRSQ